jgi:hypothetical protein
MEHHRQGGGTFGFYRGDVVNFQLNRDSFPLRKKQGVGGVGCGRVCNRRHRSTVHESVHLRQVGGEADGDAGAAGPHRLQFQLEMAQKRHLGENFIKPPLYFPRYLFHQAISTKSTPIKITIPASTNPKEKRSP